MNEVPLVYGPSLGPHDQEEIRNSVVNLQDNMGTLWYTLSGMRQEIDCSANGQAMGVQFDNVLVRLSSLEERFEKFILED